MIEDARPAWCAALRLPALAVLVWCVSVSALLAQAGSFWCPMHPDIRGQAGDRCPICRMALVPQPAPSDAYWLDLVPPGRVFQPGVPQVLRFAIRDPRKDEVTRQFDPQHERILHLFIVSHDLEYFTHVHPVQRRDGSFEEHVVLPRAGAYRLIADFVPSGAPPQLVQKSIVTAGYRGSLLRDGRLVLDVADKVVDGVRVKAVIPEPVAGREQLVTFELEDAGTGRPIDDLEPYLGATGHLLLVGADLQTAAHSHPVADLSNGPGPRVVFQVVFPREGDYRVWLQVQRGGRVLTVPFTVRARPRPQGVFR